MGKREDMERLHRLHDGELDAEARAAVEAGLSDDDRARLAAMDELGAALRHTASAEADGFDVADAVMAAIGKQATAPLPAPTPITSARRWRARAIWASTAATLAAAAAAALFLVTRPAIPPHGDACSIESLEVSGEQATVLDLTDAHGHDTGTVVWLDEED